MAGEFFEWGYEGDIKVSSKDVLEGLQPRPDIRTFLIEGYGGENFPSWMSILPLNNLTELRLEGCRKCRELPTLGSLPRLKFLHLHELDTVKCIGNEFYSSNGSEAVLFPALQKLALWKMDGLEEWMVPGGAGDQVVAIFPCLEKLDIWYCFKLKSIPVCHLSSLEEFIIEGCDELRYLCDEFSGFTSLQVLNITKCKKLVSIPSVQHCTALVNLGIWDCPELISIPGDFQELKYCLKKLRISDLKLRALPSGLQCRASLEELSIRNCRELLHINDLQELSSLKRLTIHFCEKLISVPYGLQKLHSLVELTIEFCWSLTHFPEDCLGCLTQLKELNIGGFSAGIINSIQHLSGSLKELRIHGWDKLRNIPPQLQHLSKLNQLSISNCKELIHINDLRRLSSLVELEIIQCQSLTHFPEDCFSGLTQLKRLSIGGFSEQLEAFPAGVTNSIQHHLSGSLGSLKIHGWNNVRNIPHQLQHLASLTIKGFSGVEALPDWLANLSSLQHLRIYNCENLKHLPSSIAMQRLSKLNRLSIWNCPLLEENCRKDNGSEWPKISHINVSSSYPI